MAQPVSYTHLDVYKRQEIYSDVKSSGLASKVISALGVTLYTL